MLPSVLQKIFGPQLLKVQQKAGQMLQDLQELRLEGQAGSGAVRVIVSGTGELQEVKIDPKLLNPDELEVLQDLIVLAVRDAAGKVEETQRQKMSEALKDFPLGKLLGLGR